ncbi:hypothetical protein [Persephonella sp.]
MRKLFLLFTVAVLFSCAPLVKEESCKIQFEKIKELSQQENDYKIRGNLFLHGIYLVFYGKLGNSSEIIVRSPFGKRLFTVRYTGEEVCVRLPESPEKCGKDLDIYWDYLNVKIPFDLKRLLTGKPKITDDATYSCVNGKLIVKENETKLFYRNTKLEKIEYKEFQVYYSYEEGRLKKITVKNRDKEIFRIYIRQLEEL